VKDEQAALRWLFGFTDWERGIGWGNRSSPDLSWNLGRTRWLLDAVGNPDRDVPVVLIAGTKGKGSTAALIESIVRASGKRTVLYTQPHLQNYRERIRLDGAPITAKDFAELTNRFREPVDRFLKIEPEAGEPTTYEITTAMAMLAASDHQADLAVIEVGLGGRLDATNCLDPAVSVLTRVSYDHTQILGPTLGAITREKVAIARPNRPLISAPQRPAAQRAMVRAAREIGARYRVVPPMMSVGRSTPPTRGTQRVSGMVLNQRFESELALLGEHQRENAAVAIAACEALAGAGAITLEVKQVEEGLSTVVWPGRLETMPGSPRIVLDGAHNGESAERLVCALRESFMFDRLILVLGILRDKDARTMLRSLLPAADTVIVTRSMSPRALEPSVLADLSQRAHRDVRSALTVSDALRLARALAKHNDLICVTGSLTIVGEARAILLPQEDPHPYGLRP